MHIHSHYVVLKAHILRCVLQYVLQFDGRGAFEFKAIDADTEEFGS